jgi:hypothetical protein
MSAVPPRATELVHRNELTRGAITGLMHRNKRIVPMPTIASYNGLTATPAC